MSNKIAGLIGRTYCDYCGAIFLLEFAEPAAIHNASNDISHVKGLAKIRANNPVQLCCWVQWLLNFRGWLQWLD
jgi:hypothetical protein